MIQPHESAQLLSAAHFAAVKHSQQRRKDVEASPYINHPIEVAQVLAIFGGVSDTALLQAAILHDTIEDTQTSAEELDLRFGPDVRKLVEEVTDDKSLPKAERKQLQVEHAQHASERARQLKIADKICNVREIGRSIPQGWTRQRCIEYFDWAERVVAGCRGPNLKLESHFDRILQESRNRFAPEA